MAPGSTTTLPAGRGGRLSPDAIAGFSPADIALSWLTLSGVFMAMTFAVFAVYGLLANAFRQAVISSPRVQVWLRHRFATIFAGLGLNLAFSDR